MSVLRQYLQTAVAFMRSRSCFLNVGMRARTSGGRRLIGANKFLSWYTLVEMDDNLSIWVRLDLKYVRESALEPRLYTESRRSCKILRIGTISFDGLPQILTKIDSTSPDVSRARILTERERALHLGIVPWWLRKRADADRKFHSVEFPHRYSPPPLPPSTGTRAFERR